MHRSRLSPLTILLAAMIILSGCTRPSGKPPEPTAPPLPAASATTSSPTPEPPASATPAVSPEGASLFPSTDRELSFVIWDAGAAKAAHPVEQWLREGERLVIASNGKPYATWLFAADGVWRLDPKGGGALLRYIPATLKDGETWRQRSGDAEVWFSLTRDDSTCRTPGGHIVEAAARSCWTLTVLNRGELTTFRFAPAGGPTLVKAVNYAQPSASFYKEVATDQAGDRPAVDRKALLEKAPASSAPRAAVIAATAADFAAVRQTLPGIVTVRADLDGDGREETVRGPLDAWTTANVEILDKDGNLLAASRTWDGLEQRVSLVRFRGASQSFVLVQTRGNGGEPEMTIARLEPWDKSWPLKGSRGWDWDPKDDTTAASRVAVAEDGLVTVEWDLGDPARHTRVRQYRFDPVKFEAKQETESVRTEGKELLYPADPLGVLQAAFVAKWYKLEDEFPRYFATKETAASFRGDKRIAQIAYRPDGVRSDLVLEDSPNCHLQTTPATPGAKGPMPFVASYGAGEWGITVWGWATFTKDAQGRPVIQQFYVQGSCSAGA